MKKIKNLFDLKSEITRLEAQQSIEKKLLRLQFISTCENLKPLNLLKNSFKEITHSSSFNDNILSTGVGLTSGYLSKKIVVGFSHNPIKKILGSILQFGVATIVSKNPEGVKLLAGKILNFISKKR